MARDESPPTLSRRSVIASAAPVPVAASQSAPQPVEPAFAPSQRRIVESLIQMAANWKSIALG